MTSSPPLVGQFVDYLRYERHFSPYTARCYNADLRQYVEFLNGDTVSGATVEPSEATDRSVGADPEGPLEGGNGIDH